VRDRSRAIIIDIESVTRDALSLSVVSTQFADTRGGAVGSYMFEVSLSIKDAFSSALVNRALRHDEVMLGCLDRADAIV
jgi:hypothetical protein